MLIWKLHRFHGSWSIVRDFFFIIIHISFHYASLFYSMWAKFAKIDFTDLQQFFLNQKPGFLIRPYHSTCQQKPTKTNIINAPTPHDYSEQLNSSRSIPGDECFCKLPFSGGINTTKMPPHQWDSSIDIQFPMFLEIFVNNNSVRQTSFRICFRLFTVESCILFMKFKSSVAQLRRGAGRSTLNYPEHEQLIFEDPSSEIVHPIENLSEEKEPSSVTSRNHTLKKFPQINSLIIVVLSLSCFPSLKGAIQFLICYSKKKGNKSWNSQIFPISQSSCSSLSNAFQKRFIISENKYYLDARWYLTRKIQVVIYSKAFVAKEYKITTCWIASFLILPNMFSQYPTMQQLQQVGKGSMKKCGYSTKKTFLIIDTEIYGVFQLLFFYFSAFSIDEHFCIFKTCFFICCSLIQIEGIGFTLQHKYLFLHKKYSAISRKKRIQKFGSIEQKIPQSKDDTFDLESTTLISSPCKTSFVYLFHMNLSLEFLQLEFQLHLQKHCIWKNPWTPGCLLMTRLHNFNIIQQIFLVLRPETPVVVESISGSSARVAPGQITYVKLKKKYPSNLYPGILICRDHPCDIFMRNAAEQQLSVEPSHVSFHLIHFLCSQILLLTFHCLWYLSSIIPEKEATVGIFFILTWISNINNEHDDLDSVTYIHYEHLNTFWHNNFFYPILPQSNSSPVKPRIIQNQKGKYFISQLHSFDFPNVVSFLYLYSRTGSMIPQTGKCHACPSRAISKSIIPTHQFSVSDQASPLRNTFDATSSLTTTMENHATTFDRSLSVSVLTDLNKIVEILVSFLLDHAFGKTTKKHLNNCLLWKNEFWPTGQRPQLRELSINSPPTKMLVRLSTQLTYKPVPPSSSLGCIWCLDKPVLSGTIHPQIGVQCAPLPGPPLIFSPFFPTWCLSFTYFLSILPWENHTHDVVNTNFGSCLTNSKFDLGSLCEIQAQMQELVGLYHIFKHFRSLGEIIKKINILLYSLLTKLGAPIQHLSAPQAVLFGQKHMYSSMISLVNSMKPENFSNAIKGSYVFNSSFIFLHGIHLKNGGNRHWWTFKNIPLVGSCITLFFLFVILGNLCVFQCKKSCGAGRNWLDNSHIYIYIKAIFS
ncbi:hypothetical protein VP01_95g3 [Puccinia sorghi]|uniref:Uncharacterized protein n=1 Tax=Puccinia sorghi TaxID=27349 RepID=A0A0L6U671_9BASI|nr:hypothetical protein VP01_95g3 [Puccinia sorghi]